MRETVLSAVPEAIQPIKDTTSEEPIYKEVVIIGNGPSAIAASYMLAGHWPYYCGTSHAIEYLHSKLVQNWDKSLIEQDLQFLCEGLEGRSTNPVSVLFDILNHPDADLGMEVPSLLKWVKHDDKAIEHVVLGKGNPGGAWQNMEGSTLTISLRNWMELPNVPFVEWEQFRNCYSGSKQSRASVSSVARYYEDYVKWNGLERFFKNHSTVTSVKLIASDKPDSEPCWEVQGFCSANEKHFTYITPSVVLATGAVDLPNKLHVPGEDLSFVIHSIAEMEKLIRTQKLTPHSDSLLIIGAGLTAADAIITARFFGIPVTHVFRRDVCDPSLVLNKLPENMYPEYHKVHQMMKGRGLGYRGYQGYPKHQVVSILPDLKVCIEGPECNEILQVSYVLILIGSSPDLSYLQNGALDLGREVGQPVDCRKNPILCDAYTHQSTSVKGLFALGPLAGDNFVRFLQGGALAVINYLHQRKLQTDAVKLSV